MVEPRFRRHTARQSKIEVASYHVPCLAPERQSSIQQSSRSLSASEKRLRSVAAIGGRARVALKGTGNSCRMLVEAQTVCRDALVNRHCLLSQATVQSD